MGLGEELSLDDIDALLEQPEPTPTHRRLTVVEPPRPNCRQCDTKLDNGYCKNPECPVDTPVPTEPCEYCGHCSTPGECVASVRCPRCGSEPSELCRDDRNGLTGYHEERWLRVKEQYGNYYKA